VVIILVIDGQQIIAERDRNSPILQSEVFFREVRSYEKSKTR